MIAGTIKLWWKPCLRSSRSTTSWVKWLDWGSLGNIRSILYIWSLKNKNDQSSKVILWLAGPRKSPLTSKWRLRSLAWWTSATTRLMTTLVTSRWFSLNSLWSSNWWVVVQVGSYFYDKNSVTCSSTFQVGHRHHLFPPQHNPPHLTSPSSPHSTAVHSSLQLLAMLYLISIILNTTEPQKETKSSKYWTSIAAHRWL